MHTVAEFSIRKREYLRADGTLSTPPPAACLDPHYLLAAYRHMVLSRTFDTKVIALQRTGQLGTYASVLGQEAIGTAIGLALQTDDLFVPYYRDVPTQLLRGVTMVEIMQYWGGDERGNNFAHQRRDLPDCVPIATQITHAAGAAAAMKIRRQPQAVVTTCGDGATSRGDFYEALNVAGAWQLPLVVVVNNNQWAISVRRQYQTGAATLAQKGIAAGTAAEQVDGNDIMAMRAALDSALSRARAGKGATLIEAISYRLGDHTTADDASRYRSAAEVSDAWSREPVKRLQTYLHQQGLWSPAQEQALLAEAQQQVAAAVEAYRQIPPQAPDSLFEHLFAEWPAPYAWQRRVLADKVARQTSTAGNGGNGHGH